MDLLELKNVEPIFGGGENEVYTYPGKEHLLVKIIRPEWVNANLLRSPIIFRLIRLPKYWGVLNELIEYLAVYETKKPEAKYIETIVGLVTTDIGLGLVVETIFHEPGTIAKPLEGLIISGEFSEIHQQELEKVFEWMIKTHIVIRDFTLNNLVWDGINKNFVIIDGIGSKPLWSLRTFSKAYNRRGNRKRIEKFRKRLAKRLEK